MKLTIRSKKRGEFVCMYDECDKDIVSRHTWHVTAQGYAATNVVKNGKKTIVLMHHLILTDLKPGLVCDHINRNRLDNRRSNLRTCTRQQNNRNATPYGETGYLGVVYNRQRSGGAERVYIKAQIRVGNKTLNLGNFKTLEDAARARDAATIKYFGEYGSLNFPNR